MVARTRPLGDGQLSPLDQPLTKGTTMMKRKRAGIAAICLSAVALAGAITAAPATIAAPETVSQAQAYGKYVWLNPGQCKYVNVSRASWAADWRLVCNYDIVGHNVWVTFP